MSAENLHTNEEILQKIAQGDEQAFTVLITRNWKNIFGYALAWLKSPEQAEEMAQDVFVKLWKNRERLLKVKDIDNYLFIIARNTMVSMIRTKLRQPEFVALQEKEEDYCRPDQLLENKEIYAVLMEGISLLPAKRQQVFRMSRLEGLSNAEIAQQLGMNKDTVKQYLVKAVVFLKAYLKEKIKSSWIFIFLFF